MGLGLFKAAGKQPPPEEHAQLSALEILRAKPKAHINKALPPSKFVQAIELIIKLDERRISLELEPEWLDFEVERHGGKVVRNNGCILTCEGMPVELYTLLESNLTEMESTVKSLAKERRREEKRLRTPRKQLKDKEYYPGPIAPVGMKACLLPDGGYNHVSSVEPEDNTEVLRPDEFMKLRLWAESLGIDEATVMQHHEIVKKRTTNYVAHRSNLVLVQERIRQQVIQRKKGEEKDMGLFSKAAQVAEKPAQETLKQEAEANAIAEKPMTKQEIDQRVAELFDKKVDEAQQRFKDIDDKELQAARDALGITWAKTLETQEDVDSLLRLRKALIDDLSYVIERYHELKDELEGKINTFDKVYEPMLEQWHDAHPPEGGRKSRELMYGTIGRRNKPATAAQNDEADDALKQGWLKKCSTAMATAFDIKTVPRLVPDMEKVKAWYMDLATKGKTPDCPLYKFSPAEENKFFISPTIDTVKEKLRKERKHGRS